MEEKRGENMHTREEEEKKRYWDKDKRRERRERKMKIWEEERKCCRGREKIELCLSVLILGILVF